MAQITLDPGEKQKIISQPSDGDAYNINVDGARVYLSHRANGIVREGKAVKKGDRTVASNLRGKPIYAKNPSTNENTATLEVDRAGFALSFQSRAVIGAVDTGRGDAEAPASSDEDVHRYETNADPSAGITESFRAPNAGEAVMVSVDDANDAFEVAVIFTDEDGNEITRRDDDNSGTYSGNENTDVFAETVIASEYVTVEITGAATSADYTVYAR